jgi:hypothetical protein
VVTLEERDPGEPHPGEAGLRAGRLPRDHAAVELARTVELARVVPCAGGREQRRDAAHALGEGEVAARRSRVVPLPRLRPRDLQLCVGAAGDRAQHRLDLVVALRPVQRAPELEPYLRLRRRCPLRRLQPFAVQRDRRLVQPLGRVHASDREPIGQCHLARTQLLGRLARRCTAAAQLDGAVKRGTARLQVSHLDRRSSGRDEELRAGARGLRPRARLVRQRAGGGGVARGPGRPDPRAPRPQSANAIGVPDHGGANPRRIARRRERIRLQKFQPDPGPARLPSRQPQVFSRLGAAADAQQCKAQPQPRCLPLGFQFPAGWCRRQERRVVARRTRSIACFVTRATPQIEADPVRLRVQTVHPVQQRERLRPPPPPGLRTCSQHPPLLRRIAGPLHVSPHHPRGAPRPVGRHVPLGLHRHLRGVHRCERDVQVVRHRARRVAATRAGEEQDEHDGRHGECDQNQLRSTSSHRARIGLCGRLSRVREGCGAGTAPRGERTARAAGGPARGGGAMRRRRHGRTETIPPANRLSELPIRGCHVVDVRRRRHLGGSLAPSGPGGGGEAPPSRISTVGTRGSHTATAARVGGRGSTLGPAAQLQHDDGQRVGITTLRSTALSPTVLRSTGFG